MARRKVRIVVEEVPEHLRVLIPLAEEWGYWLPDYCDELLDKKSPEELRLFVRTIELHRKAIDEWLETMPRDGEKWPKAANAFLYLVRSWHEAACEVYAQDTYNTGKTEAETDK